MPLAGRIPDFFIVGAPKCGTTALYSYLETHPDIFMSPVKEPHYFYRDFRSSAAPGGRVGGFARPEHYSQLFAKAADNQLCGEGSTLYLFSRFAIPDLLQANPRARLIAMVRNPLEMAVSFHQQKVYDLEEDQADFAVAWSLSEARARGCSVPPGCRAPEELDYKSICRLGEQIQRLLKTAPREQVHIIVYDDFVADTSGAYRGALRFLGLSDNQRTDFPVVNAQREHWLPWVSSLIKRPPLPALQKIKSWMIERFPSSTKRAAQSIRQLNSRRRPKREIPVEIKREMVMEFAADIELLGGLLGRPFDHWYKHVL